jgi:hypothetical protein
MRRFFSIFLLFFMCATATIHAATPLENHMEIKDGRHIITKTFEAKPDENPDLLKETPFEQDGFSYTYFETLKEVIPLVETRQEVQTATVTTSGNDVQSILAEVEGYTTETYSISDSMTFVGLGSNDPSNIPKSTVKNGVTLSLKNIDWSIQESQTVDYDVIPTKYKAVANYAGSYSKKVPTGYVSTVEYKGDVTKTETEKVIYTITYIGTEIPKPTPEPTPEPVVPQNETPSIMMIAGIIALILIIGGAIVAFFVFFFNTYIYIKNDDEYRLIAKKRIRWHNPVVDLSGLEIAGKEVAIHVKRRTAEKLFGRYIPTVADANFSTRHMVDKQNCDFWYIVNIPTAPDHADDETDSAPDFTE